MGVYRGGTGHIGEVLAHVCDGQSKAIQARNILDKTKIILAVYTLFTTRITGDHGDNADAFVVAQRARWQSGHFRHLFNGIVF